ncbi:hypothetical protein [Spirosoma fluviale]|uniref:Uncharacterized protein n=1 Tax=Spirosoma fluviale TaxID=1597977 RepID=A0A286FC60_9BACT|nr:hypothetical protein [Spirosoma fluviale]SOD80815.1 hypothetical protein SAMN06269250_1576 [Spirosoma fluviale]
MPSIFVQFSRITFQGQFRELYQIIEIIERELTVHHAHAALNRPGTAGAIDLLNTDMAMARTVLAMHEGTPAPPDSIPVIVKPIDQSNSAPIWGFFMFAKVPPRPLTPHRIAFLAWVEEVNQILREHNRTDLELDVDEVDHEIAYAFGYKPQTIANAILGKPEPPKPKEDVWSKFLSLNWF